MENPEYADGSSRPGTVQQAATAAAEPTARSEQAAPLASLAIFFTWPPAALRALAAPFVHHAEAFPRCPAHCRVGPEPAHFARFRACSGVFALR